MVKSIQFKPIVDPNGQTDFETVVNPNGQIDSI